MAYFQYQAQLFPINGRRNIESTTPKGKMQKSSVPYRARLKNGHYRMTVSDIPANLKQ
jgi:hypothetical protein